MIYDRQKVEKVFWFRDFFMFKGLCIYSTKEGCKVLNEVCEWGTTCQFEGIRKGPLFCRLDLVAELPV